MGGLLSAVHDVRAVGAVIVVDIGGHSSWLCSPLSLWSCSWCLRLAVVGYGESVVGVGLAWLDIGSNALFYPLSPKSSSPKPRVRMSLNVGICVGLVGR